MPTTQHKDPVEAENAAGQSEYRGHTYYFCSQGCKEKFEQHPEQYEGKSSEGDR
ncbi:MAG: YHS domain-containing protein [Pyrinomonadaceae bacterium]|nr:YHS domain-containing protein [Pyrinomonadaceae bacterium]